MRTPGSARTRTATSRRPASMRVDASNIAITPISAPGATRRNITARGSSAPRCPRFGARSQQDLKKRALEPRCRSCRGRSPSRHRDICGSETSNMHATTRASARRRFASRHVKRNGRQADDALHWQARHRPRGADHGPQPEAHCRRSATICPASICSSTSMTTANRVRSPPPT